MWLPISVSVSVLAGSVRLVRGESVESAGPVCPGARTNACDSQPSSGLLARSVVRGVRSKSVPSDLAHGPDLTARASSPFPLPLQQGERRKCSAPQSTHPQDLKLEVSRPNRGQFGASGLERRAGSCLPHLPRPLRKGGRGWTPGVPPPSQWEEGQWPLHEEGKTTPGVVV